jgi:hypothetical protein
MSAAHVAHVVMAVMVAQVATMTVVHRVVVPVVQQVAMPLQLTAATNPQKPLVLLPNPPFSASAR